MKRKLNILKLDFLMVIRNGFFYLLIFSGIFLVFMNYFFTRNEIDIMPNEYIVDNTEGKFFSLFLMDKGINENSIIETKKLLDEKIQKEKGSIGVVVKGNMDSINVEIISNEKISGKNINILKTSIEYIFHLLKNDQNIKITLLRKSIGNFSRRKIFLPVLILLEVISIGFMFLPVIMFDEKREGIIKILNISPLSAFSYLNSKIIFFVSISVLYALFMLLLSWQYVNIPYFVINIILSSMFMSLFGILSGVLNDNLSEWFMFGIIFMFIYFMPMISFVLPSFSPSYIKIIPSYSMMFSLKEIILYNSNYKFFYKHFIVLIIENMILYVCVYYTLKNKLFGRN